MLNSDVFFRTFKNNEKHLKYIKEFCDKYHLPYRFTDDDSNIAPALLAKDGFYANLYNSQFQEAEEE